jgi:hypothetical protein
MKNFDDHLNTQLKEAIVIAIADLITNKTTFSIHNITTFIRSAVSKGELDIPGCNAPEDIHHLDVRKLFRTMLTDKELDSFKLIETHNGVYFEYTPTSVPNSMGLSTTTSTSTVWNNSDIKSTDNKMPYSENSPIARIPKDEVMRRIETYLGRCSDKGVNPTIKLVQSAIKRGDELLGWTCRELENLITANEYKVHLMLNRSKSIVLLV